MGADGARGLHSPSTARPAFAASDFSKRPGDLLVKDANGFWAGFVLGVRDGDLYRFWVVGQGPGSSEGFKRDPYARELELRRVSAAIASYAIRGL